MQTGNQGLNLDLKAPEKGVQLLDNFALTIQCLIAEAEEDEPEMVYDSEA